MMSKSCEKLKVALCISFLITFTITSAELKESELNEMEVVFNTIEEKQSVLKNIMKKLILKYADPDSTPDPDPEPSDSCVCIPYYQCDENTHEVIRDGRFILNSRFGESNPCTDSIEVCCKRNNLKSRISTNDPIRKCGYRYAKLDTTNTDNPNQAKLGEFPWTTLIRDRTSYQCVGSLIHPQVVLTAAHCANLSTSYLAVSGKLILGDPNEPLQIQKVTEIIHHPNFRRDNLHYDVALLVLENPFKLTEYVNTVCLPSSSPQKLMIDYKKCVANGWGKLSSHSNGYEKVMKKSIFSLMSHRECQNNLRETRLGRYFELDGSFVCASKIHGATLCDGDRGAPLACSIPEYKDRYQQVGALSWGLYCNEDPSIFSKISHVRSWIDEQFQLHNFDKNYYIV